LAKTPSNLCRQADAEKKVIPFAKAQKSERFAFDAAAMNVLD
jgi:hypothetical protein